MPRHSTPYAARATVSAVKRMHLASRNGNRLEAFGAGVKTRACMSVKHRSAINPVTAVFFYKGECNHEMRIRYREVVLTLRSRGHLALFVRGRPFSNSLNMPRLFLRLRATTTRATTIVMLAKFRPEFPRRSFPALRQQGVLRFVLLGRPSARCALSREPCGVLHDALFGSLSVQHGVSCAPLGGRSAGTDEPPDDSLVLHGALPASFYGACVPP
jgi:hypothetical protein